MTADFFRKRGLFFVALISCFIVCVGFFYAASVQGAASVELDKTFYLLVSDEEHVAVSAENAYLEGGAGYVLVNGKSVYAVYACYFTSTDAEKAKENLDNKSIRTKILLLNTDTIYLKSLDQKANKREIEGAFGTVYSCLRLLGDYASGAETGAYTQEALKDLLGETRRVIRALTDRSKKYSFRLSSALKETEEEIEDILSGIVYAKDIRYAQMRLCDGYLCAVKELSL